MDVYFYASCENLSECVASIDSLPSRGAYSKTLSLQYPPNLTKIFGVGGIFFIILICIGIVVCNFILRERFEKHRILVGLVLCFLVTVSAVFITVAGGFYFQSNFSEVCYSDSDLNAAIKALGVIFIFYMLSIMLDTSE